MKNIQLPLKLRSIGDSAFIRCISLTEIEIPETVTQIGKCAFFNCNELVKVIIPCSLKNTVQNGVFNNKIKEIIYKE